MNFRKVAVLLAASFLFLIIVALGCVATGCSAEHTPSESASTGSTSTLTTNTQAMPQARREFRVLPGKWARTDGDYLLEIRQVRADGTLEAGYFNPRPINIYAARTDQEGSLTKVFVELRDVGYPGCTYTLLYNPGLDQLVGTYYQAAVQQNYDVTFQRVKNQ
jgi:hypothetical protein